MTKKNTADDILRVEAAQTDEYETLSFVVDIRGTKMEFTVPADAMDWPAAASDDFEEGREREAIKKIIGLEQYAKAIELGARNRDIAAIVEEWFSVSGLAESGSSSTD